MKKTIAVVGHGLVPSALSNQLLEKTSAESEKLTVNEIVEQGNRMYIRNYELPEANYDYGMTKKQMNQVVVPIRTEPKYQNNEPCPCGSGNKYKKCCKKV